MISHWGDGYKHGVFARLEGNSTYAWNDKIGILNSC